MKRMMALAVVVAGVATCTVAVEAGGAKGDKAKLQGKWELTGISVAGKDLPTDTFKLILTFQGDKVISQQGDKKEEESTYTLDEKKKPRQMTVAKTAKDDEIKLIYVLEGDTLKAARSAKGSGSDRPAALEDKEAVLYTFKRIKK